MDSYRKKGIITGILFLTAMIFSLVGGGLVESAISSDVISDNRLVLLIGISLEILNGIVVIGIAASLFPFLRSWSESLALGYVGLRILES